MKDYEIYKVVIGQIVRHFLSGFAVLLGAYGVSTDEQSVLVEDSVSIVVSILVFAFVMAWSYLSKHAALYAIPPDMRGDPDDE
jgi:hypothetical protein